MMLLAWKQFVVDDSAQVFVLEYSLHWLPMNYGCSPPHSMLGEVHEHLLCLGNIQFQPSDHTIPQTYDLGKVPRARKGAQYRPQTSPDGWLGWRLLQSSVYRMNSWGERTQPWGEPVDMCWLSESLLLTSTFCVLRVRKSMIHKINWWSRWRQFFSQDVGL